MEINGVAHIFLTASNFEASTAFYKKLLPFLGLTQVIDTDQTVLSVISSELNMSRHADKALEVLRQRSQ